jgi:hypothetical protein
MKQIIRAIQVKAGIKMIASSLCLLFLSCGLILSQETLKVNDAYDIINKENYGDDVLYYKTISYSSLSGNQERFNYEFINEHNFKRNWVLETTRYVNFDTIFNVNQRLEISEKFKKLISLKIEPSKLNNPKSLSKEKTGKFYQTENLEGFINLTYPIIQEGLNGKFYGFIYIEYYSEGILFIFEKSKSGWREFAKVPIWIS